MIGLATAGNATLICYDNGAPVLSTDPWLCDEDPAYFGSWIGTHTIPNAYKNDMYNSKHIWVSHGHPDHLNPLSIKKFKKNKILISDHYGSRIYKDMAKENYNISIIPDKKWIDLSSNVSIQSITTPNQDSILLVNLNGTLFVNLNDADTINCTRYIRKISNNFKNSYLMALASYGDADMINFFDESGNFVVPPAKNNKNVGTHLSLVANSLGLKGAIPFSSHHTYQREDSIWAQEYVTPSKAYQTGLNKNLKFVKPFSFIDCTNDQNQLIGAEPITITPKKPEFFGDNYSDILEFADIEKIKEYFKKKEELFVFLKFINFRVGGSDNFIDFNKSSNKGITFTVPRNSLMTAIKYEIFDDLLIGNFMKTTLHNMKNLYENEFNQKLTKYSDNGQVYSQNELKKYMAFYKKKAGREFIYEKFLDKSKSIFHRLFPNTNKASSFYKIAKSIYYKIK